MTLNFDSVEFDRIIDWICSNLEHGVQLDEIRNKSDSDIQSLQRVLAYRNDLTSIWKELVDYAYRTYISDDLQSVMGADGILDLSVLDKSIESNWHYFLSSLSDADRELTSYLKHDIYEILLKLKWNDGGKGVNKGLIIGDARSNKTLNITGLINAVFDIGWDVVILFTGRNRFRRSGQDHRLDEYFNYSQRHYQTRISLFADIDILPSNCLLKTSKNHVCRYLIYGLKNTANINKLMKWFPRDDTVRKDLRVLIIDEQMSRSAADIMVSSSNEDKALSELLYDVSNRVPFASTNYLTYTSACYDIFLKRLHSESIFPIDFTVQMSRGDKYVSTDDIFSSSDIVKGTFSAIVNDQGDADLELLDIYKGNYKSIDILKDSFAWALCANAILNLHGSVEPCTFLIPVDTKESHISSMTSAIFSSIIDGDVIERCRDVYCEQTQRIDLMTFVDHQLCSDDDRLPYPDFDDICPIIKRTLDGGVIKVPENTDFTNSGIVVCYDINKEEERYSKYSPRQYVDKMSELRYVKSEPGQSPLYVLIAFRNISRGIDLRRLISTYYAKTSDKKDANVPMGLWCGRHNGYEALPRIWMTKESRDYYHNLNDIENGLRSYLLSHNIRHYTDLPESLLNSMNPIRMGNQLYSLSVKHTVCSVCGKELMEGEPCYKVQGPMEEYRCYDCQHPRSQKCIESRGKASKQASSTIHILFDKKYISEKELEQCSGLTIGRLTIELFKAKYVVGPVKCNKPKFEKFDSKYTMYELKYCPEMFEFCDDLKRCDADQDHSWLFIKYHESWNWIIDHLINEFEEIMESIGVEKKYFNTLVYDHEDFAGFDEYCTAIVLNCLGYISSEKFRMHYSDYEWVREELSIKNRNIIINHLLIDIIEKCPHIFVVSDNVISFGGKELVFNAVTVCDIKKYGLDRSSSDIVIKVNHDSITVISGDDESLFQNYFGINDPDVDNEIRFICNLVGRGF